MADELKAQLLQRAEQRIREKGRRGLSRKAGRPQQPGRIMAQYRARLREISEATNKAIRESIIENLPRLIELAGTRDDAMRADDWSEELARLIRATRVTLERETDAEAERLADEFAKAVAAQNRQQMNRIMRRVMGVDIFADDERLSGLMSSWVRENAQLIRSIPEQALDRVEGLTNRAVRSGRSVTDVAKDIRKEFGVTRRRARVIARDQIASLNANITRERQREVGIEEYEWATADDERVRGDPSGRYPDAMPRHDVMNGKICRWDDPTVYRERGSDKWLQRSSLGGPSAHPGEPILCRCTALPEVEHLLQEIERGQT